MPLELTLIQILNHVIVVIFAVLPSLWAWFGMNAIKKVVRYKAKKNKQYYVNLGWATIFVLSVTLLLVNIIASDLITFGIKSKWLVHLANPPDWIAYICIALGSPVLITFQLMPLNVWQNVTTVVLIQTLLVMLQLVWGWLGIESIKYIITTKPNYQAQYLAKLLLALLFIGWLLFWQLHPTQF